MIKGACVKEARPFDGAEDAETSSGERRDRMVLMEGVRIVKVVVRDVSSMIIGRAVQLAQSSATSVVVGSRRVPPRWCGLCRSLILLVTGEMEIKTASRS